VGGVIAASHVRRVVVVPRNGLANRLQAWASAAILAKQWEAPLHVVWEPEEVLPAPAEVLFARAMVSESFSSPDLIQQLTQQTHSDLPRYLSRRGDVIVLAGHDRGEQEFMVDLVAAVAASPDPVSVILIAGGNFHLPGVDDSRNERSVFYRGITWSDQVCDRVMAAQPPTSPYLALHIRQTDRAIDAPSSRALRAALRRLRQMHPSERGLFISADSPEALVSWTDVAVREGFAPWSLPDVSHQRNGTSGIVDAAADWILLSRATALVHPGASTFSTEAAVASGYSGGSVALRAGPILRAMRRAKELLRAVATYPSRRNPAHTTR